jgi:phospholipid N-methyltransferase
MPRHVGPFLQEFVRDPVRTGGLVPSSRYLARQAVEPIAATGEPVVVELGPGTGAMTRAIEQRMTGRGHHIAVELNPRFAELIARRHPTVDVANEDAVKLPQLLAERGYEHADTIVSGLPWASFPAELQNTLLQAVTTSLAPGGVFTTFAYVHALGLTPARRFRARLEASFGRVVVGRTVWRNVPPALVYFARHA